MVELVNGKDTPAVVALYPGNALRLQSGMLEMRVNRGFTLTEMGITIAIVAILLALAAPSYQQLMVDSRMTAQASELVTMLHFAQSEAYKRNARVTVCKSSDGEACTTSGTWAQGWIVFVDGGTIATVNIDEGDIVLRAHAALAGGSTLVGDTEVANAVSYLARGRTAQAGRFDLCSTVSGSAGRDIIVGASSAHVETDTAPVTCS